jgi:hypothetical protein
MSTGGLRRGAAPAERLRWTADVVLAEVLAWRMDGPRWAGVADLVAAVDHAVTADDLGALATATAALEAATPVRAQRISGPPEHRVGIADELRERINRVHHELRSATGEGDADVPDPGDG